MKKVMALALAVMLMVALAVPSFAWAPSEVLLSGSYTVGGNGVTIGTLKTLQLGATEKAYLEEWLTSPNRILGYNPSSKTYMFHTITSTAPSNLRLTLGSTTAVPTNVNVRTISGTAVLRTLSFNASTKLAGSLYTGSIVASGAVQNLGIIISSALFAANPSLIVDISDAHFMDYDSLHIEDDGGLFADPDPDPGSGSSSEPNPIGGGVVVPPSDNPYVPYDTTAWNGFYKSMTTAIGNGTNVGFVLFAFIMSILVVIKIVKIFAKA